MRELKEAKDNFLKKCMQSDCFWYNQVIAIESRTTLHFP